MPTASSPPRRANDLLASRRLLGPTAYPSAATRRAASGAFAQHSRFSGAKDSRAERAAAEAALLAAHSDPAALDDLLADIDSALERARGQSAIDSTPSSVSPADDSHALNQSRGRDGAARASGPSARMSPTSTMSPGGFLSVASPAPAMPGSGSTAAPHSPVTPMMRDAAIVASLSPIAASPSSDVSRSIAHAQRLLGQGHWSDAKSFAEGTLQRRWPHMPEGYYVAGFAAFKLRDYAAAVHALAMCSELMCAASLACRVTSPGPDPAEVGKLLVQARKALRMSESRTEQAAAAATREEQHMSPARRCARATGRAVWRVCGFRVPTWALVIVALAVALSVAVVDGDAIDAALVAVGLAEEEAPPPPAPWSGDGAFQMLFAVLSGLWWVLTSVISGATWCVGFFARAAIGMRSESTAEPHTP